MLVLNNDFVEMTHEPQDSWLFSVWKGYAKGQSYRDALMLGLEYCEKNKLTTWVADMSQAAVIDSDDALWIQEHWMSKAAEMGIVRVATIMPKGVIPKMQLRRMSAKIIEVTKDSLVVCVFEELSHALGFAKEGSTEGAYTYG